MVVGTIIGASIFVQASEVTGAVPSVGGVFAVWIVAGGLTLAGALITAELAAAVPDSGGVYAFLRDAYSPAAAAFVAVSQIAAAPANSAVGLLIVLAGYPVYVLTRSRAS